MMGTRGAAAWTSSQGIMKVEEMMSRAIIHQEDLWGLLVKHSVEHAPLEDVNNDHHLPPPEEESMMIPPVLLKALKVKLENSLDWCHLALCRLKEIIAHSGGSGGSLISHGGDDEDEEELGVKLPALEGVRKEILVGQLLKLSAVQDSREETTAAGRLHHNNDDCWSDGSLIFSARGQTCDGQESMDLIVPDQGEQRFSKLPSLGLDSDWDMLEGLPAISSAAHEVVHQSSSSCPLNVPELASDNGADIDDGSLVTKLNSRGLRPRCGPKRDREDSDEKETSVTVVFQELKPGDNTKKGIPDDGHRGWKKYGNKTIQNSTFCRGYYKCSMKDCRAKKMVQPTDKNPNVFEVTYVGSHTCTSTSRRRIRPRARVNQKPAADPAAAGSDVLVQTKIARLLKNQPDHESIDHNLQPATAGADSKEACSLEELDEDDDSCSPRDCCDDEKLDYGFPPDSLLWQEIMSNSSHREVWNSLQVEI